MIHKLKYEGMFGLAEPLSDLMFRAWPQWETAVDIVVPIPLHPERQKTRGYNQSERLAHHFGQKIGLPCNNNALERVRYTKPQVGLTAVERLENVDAAFLANPEIAKNKSVLLIDDVCTTGATLTAAANTLLSVGAKKVSAYCLARAI
jgi:ComF family protein